MIRRSIQKTVPVVIKTLKLKGNVLFSSQFLLYTNTTLSIVTATSTDLINQKLQIRQKDLKTFQVKRTRDVALAGSVTGVFCHYWYLFLDQWLPGKTFRIIAKKLFVDQLVCSPVLIALYLGITSYMENKTRKEIQKEFEVKSLRLLIAEIAIWPPAQFINFYYLPTKFRVTFDSFISFLFDFYFSRVKYSNGDSDSR